jgi:outer membrane receptor protein involved in Fe transport
MRLTPYSRDGIAVAVLLSMIASTVPAMASTTAGPIHPIVAQASAAAASVTGSVKDGTGAAVVGAHVNLTGASKFSTTTDANGAFTIAVPPGIYSIAIDRGGYEPVSLANITVAAGTSTPVSVTMSQASLSSLRTIGQVTVSTRGSQINTGTATSTYLSAQAFSNLPNPQINTVIEHAPDVTLQHMGSQPDTTIVIGAVQPYETQILIDGHPFANGQNGAWSSQYFPSYLVGGFETQSGPGNTTPFANLAVGGTANIETLGFTKANHTEITYGTDNWASQYSDIISTGSLGHLEYAIALGSAGQNNNLTNTTQFLISPDANNQATIVTALSGDGNFFNKGEVFKLKYDFTPTTSLEAGFVGAWGGYNPQGSAWSSYYGQQTVEACNQSSPQKCTNPAYDYLIGKNITGYTWYTGGWIYNNQNLYDAEFRTSLGSTTVLIRPYIADVAPENNVLTPGAGQNYYPSFYGPTGSGQFPNGAAVQPVYGANGLTGLTYNGTTYPANAAASACAGSFGNVTSPAGTYSTAGNNQFECYGSIFTTYEQDKLYGATTTILQPIGDGLLNFTYDFHGQSTYANIFDPSIQVAVPFTAERYSTFSLTGDLHPIPALAVNFGLYDTTWTVSGTQPEIAGDGTVVDDANGNPVLQALGRSVSKFDPKIGFVYHPNSQFAFRLATGGAATFPFPAQISGLPTYQSPAISLGAPFAGGGTLIEKNPNLNPETSWAYSGGIDYKFSNGSLLSLDGVQTIVHGVFEQLTTVIDRPDLPDYAPAGPVALEGVFLPFNAANLNSKSIILKYNYAPIVGLGFNLSAAANSVVVTGLTPNLYAPGSPSLPVNNVQVCGNGTTAPGITTCIPYLQGYGQFTYAFKDGAFMGLGTQYFGKNNSYFSPPFAQVDFVARKPVTKNVELQLSIENALNTNTYGTGKAIPGAGVPIVAATVNSTFTQVSQTTYPAEALISSFPRTFRIQIRIHN